MKKLLLVAVTFLTLSSAFAESKPSCNLDEVTSAALTIGQLYSDMNLDGIKITKISTTQNGVHSVETYDLWLTSSNAERVQITLGFVVRSPGNRFYGKEGCGLIKTSIPFFQAP